MKYFTPERYVALQDFSSDEAMNAADSVWEDAVRRYAEHYRSVESQLPQGIRKMQAEYYLHDAIVSNMGRQGNHFLIVLQLDTPPNDLLLFDYELTGEPTIDESALPPAYRGQGGPVEWLHDEVELTSDNPLECVHSILLSNGWELRLPFRNINVQQHAPITSRNVARAASELNYASVPGVTAPH